MRTRSRPPTVVGATTHTVKLHRSLCLKTSEVLLATSATNSVVTRFTAGTRRLGGCCFPRHRVERHPALVGAVVSSKKEGGEVFFLSTHYRCPTQEERVNSPLRAVGTQEIARTVLR